MVATTFNTVTNTPNAIRIYMETSNVKTVKTGVRSSKVALSRYTLCSAELFREEDDMRVLGMLQC